MVDEENGGVWDEVESGNVVPRSELNGVTPTIVVAVAVKSRDVTAFDKEYPTSRHNPITQILLQCFAAFAT